MATMATAANPFPGMNPFMERLWSEVHTRLVTYAADQIQEQLPPDLSARLQVQVSVEIQDEGARLVAPDVYVVEDPPGTAAGAGSAAIAVQANPLILPLPELEIVDRHVEIVEVTGGRVVTAIEFISPSNKVAPGREKYLRKQREVRKARANLVEIDLVRSGPPVTLARLSPVPAPRKTTYHASVWRADRPGQVELYPAPLRERLPDVHIPLRPSDADARLDLQTLIDACHQRGRYANLDYNAPLDPPLSDDDARWVRSLFPNDRR